MSTIPEKTIFDDNIQQHLDDTRIKIDRPLLIMLDGNEVNTRFFINKSRMVMGRDRTCDVPLHDSRCSRRHAYLEYHNYDRRNEAPHIVLVDNESTNGVYVNGERITEHRLSDRDKILMGSTLLGFFLRDESELEAEERLYHLANNDKLTNLRNRHAFDIEIKKEFDRARRYTRQLSLVLFDIDHFKIFNDTYGHQTGDFVLSEIGRIVQANIRSNDTGARYGGEEFAIVLPETALEGALIQAERLRVAVNKHAFTHADTCLQISISLGLTAMDGALESVEQFISAADRALYQAKAEGRNCVCWSRNGQTYSGTELY